MDRPTNNGICVSELEPDLIMINHGGDVGWVVYDLAPVLLDQYSDSRPGDEVWLARGYAPTPQVLRTESGLVAQVYARAG